MKQQLRIERFLGGISLVEVDVIEEKENKKLIKSWLNYKVLEFVQEKDCWEVTDEFREKPVEW